MKLSKKTRDPNTGEFVIAVWRLCDMLVILVKWVIWPVFFFFSFLFLFLQPAIIEGMETQMDYYTGESIGDFIDEPLKSSLNQNKLFTSQLESKTNWLLLSQPLLMINEVPLTLSGPWPTFTAILVTQPKILEREERLANEACLCSDYLWLSF